MIKSVDMQLILNIIKKVLQLMNFKQLTKNQNSFSNFTDEKHLSIDEKYFSDHKFLTAVDDL